MERNFQQFTFFVVTKGRKTGIYASFDEANKQIINYPEPEYLGFNSYLLALHAYKARMETLRADREALEEILAETGTVESPERTPRALPTADGRVAPVVCGAPMLPADESASHHFALNNSMELWLMMFCYDTAIPSPSYFREEIIHRQLGPMYAFNVIILGNPFGADVRAKGRYSLLEDDAREDAAFRMLWVLLQKTGKEVRDLNYLRARNTQLCTVGSVTFSRIVGNCTHVRGLVPVDLNAPTWNLILSMLKVRRTWTFRLAVYLRHFEVTGSTITHPGIEFNTNHGLVTVTPNLPILHHLFHE